MPPCAALLLLLKQGVQPMATSPEFIQFACDQIASLGDVSFKKMFGEYMIYHNGRAVFLVCDDTVFVKPLPAAMDVFAAHGVSPAMDTPYDGARPHYVLDIENGDLANDMARTLGQILPLPKPKKARGKK